jgi:hypothetical protein
VLARATASTLPPPPREGAEKEEGDGWRRQYSSAGCSSLLLRIGKIDVQQLGPAPLASLFITVAVRPT